MLRFLVAIAALVMAIHAPSALADPPGRDTRAQSFNLREAKLLIDRMALDLEKMTVEVERAGNNQAKIKAIGDKFKMQAEGMKSEGEALRKKLTDAENSELEGYAKEKIAPLTGRLLAAMMKAQLAAQVSNLEQAKALIDRMAADLERMTIEVEAAGTDQTKIKAIGDKFKAQAEGMKSEGEELRKRLTEAENKELEEYAKEKISPLTGRLLAAMMKAQMTAQQPAPATAPAPAPDRSREMPVKIGQCVFTSIESVGYRMEGETDSGVAISFANGGFQVSYSSDRAALQSKKGDPVKFCLVSKPKGCPPGDDRGREYKTTNLRTNKSWTMPDSQHGCGGA